MLTQALFIFYLLQNWCVCVHVCVCEGPSGKVSRAPPRGLGGAFVSDASACLSVKIISLLSGCPSLLTLTGEIFHGGVKTRLLERNCN